MYKFAGYNQHLTQLEIILPGSLLPNLHQESYQLVLCQQL